MAVRPGEENVATLFGDIRYFYGSPTAQPRHHRFDKGSYVYLFEDVNAGRARIEIANQPGTEDQDAFDGYLDSSRLRYSYKQTNLVTLTVGEVQGHDEWHLPTYDPHNEEKYHYKLHSLDIYFWTQRDALQFVNGIRRVIPSAQCDILDEPGPPVSAPPIDEVAERLERAAVSGSNGSHNAKSSGPVPPPILIDNKASLAPAALVPMAYNPAAPAEPEKLRPREKTPPPEDGGFNPLHQTLAYDATTPFSPGLAPTGLGPLSPGFAPPPHFHPPSGAPSFPGPPQPPLGGTISPPGLPLQGFDTLGSPAPGRPGLPGQHLNLIRAATMPVYTPHSHELHSPGLTSPYGAQIPGSPGFANQHMPTPPVSAHTTYGQGGYQPQQGAASASTPYAAHNHLYVPEASEAVGKIKPKTEVRGKLEENAGRLERGLTGMLKKFEKRFG